MFIRNKSMVRIFNLVQEAKEKADPKTRDFYVLGKLSDNLRDLLMKSPDMDFKIEETFVSPDGVECVF